MERTVGDHRENLGMILYWDKGQKKRPQRWKITQQKTKQINKSKQNEIET